MKNREIKSTLIKKHSSAAGRLLVLTGARQTGKTTLLKTTFSKYPVISLDDPVMRVQYAGLTARQWEESYPRAVLDEVQKLPTVIESIKAVYDASDKARYVLSGSSQLLLMKQVKESLAGRCIIRELFPLTLPELLTGGWDENIKPSFFQELILGRATNKDLSPSIYMNSNHPVIINAFNQYLTFGGYPFVSHEITNEEKYDWLNNYVRTYLERDVRDLADFRNLDPFVRAQQMTALNTGNLINYSFLAKEAGVSPATAHRFMTYLELSYQVLQLQPWSRNPRKRLVKTPKLHYLDIGVQHAILKKKGGITDNEFGSAVVAEIYKQSRNASLPVEFYHLRTTDGREVDLIIEIENGYYAIEIKMTNNAGNKDARHIYGLEDLLDKPLLGSFILSNDPVVKKISPSITAVPASLFLT